MRIHRGREAKDAYRGEWPDMTIDLNKNGKDDIE